MSGKSAAHRTANVYRGLQGMYRYFWVQAFITGETFDKSRKSLFILHGIPIILRFPVDLTGNPCYIYSETTGPGSSDSQGFPVNFTGYRVFL